MAGRFAPQTKVARRVHEPTTEVVPPGPVNDEPGDERIGRRSDPSGEVESAARLPVDIRPAQHVRQPPGHHIAGTARIAPQEDPAVVNMTLVANRHRPRRPTRRRRLVVDDVPLSLAVIDLLLATGQPHRLVPMHNQRRSRHGEPVANRGQFGRVVGNAGRCVSPLDHPGVGLGEFPGARRPGRENLTADRPAHRGRSLPLPAGDRGGYRGSELAVGHLPHPGP